MLRIIHPLALLAIGLLLVLLGLTADMIGLGEGTAMGWKQILAVVVGLAAAILGAYRARRR